MGLRRARNQGHANPRIGVQHRFHLFGIDLEAADVDDAAHAGP